MIFSKENLEILHPICVHFPIALTIVGMFLGTIYAIKNKNFLMNNTVRIIICLASLGAYASLISSNFTLNLTGEANDIENIHHVYALWSTISLSVTSLLYIVFWFVKKPIANWLGLISYIFLCLSTIFIALTGYYGGYIVYNILLSKYI